VCALLIAAVTTTLRGADAPRPPLLEPRVVNASIAGISLERLDVSLQIAVLAGRDLTIRSVSFSDAYVGSVPVWMAPIDGNWPLHPGQELQIPTPVIVRAQLFDALGSDGLREIVRDGSVAVRATVEVEFATPWPARLLMQPATQRAISPIAIRVPIGSGPTTLQPLAILGAALIDGVQREAAPLLLAGRNALPANRAALERFDRLVATITTSYTIESGATLVKRSIETVGFWWTPAILCTTREAFEPWWFDSVDATALQIGGGRLRTDDRYARIVSTSLRAPLEINLADLARRLGKLDERRVFALAHGEPRRIRLADRGAMSTLACVRVSDDSAIDSGPPSLVDDLPATAAAFALGRSRGPVWTDVARDNDALLTLVTPLHRYSFGSPLVTAGGIVGMVASPTAAWNAHAIAAAAARAPRIETRTHSGPTPRPSGSQTREAR
jgi:hypothetical protein